MDLIASLVLAASTSAWLPPDLSAPFRCMPDPLPAIPISYLSHAGPLVKHTVQQTSQGPVDRHYRLHAQRMLCDDGSVQVLLFVTNTTNRQGHVRIQDPSNFAAGRSLWVELCEQDFLVRQGSTSFHPRLFPGAPRHDTPLCGPIRENVTALMLPPPGAAFDPAAAFEVVTQDSAGAPRVLSVPAGRPAKRHVDWLTPHDTGSYFDPERGGEGMFVAVGPAAGGITNSVSEPLGECSKWDGASMLPQLGSRPNSCDTYDVFLAFFGYEDDGTQLWLTAGAGGVRRDVDWIEAPLVYSEGGIWGSRYNPNEVQRSLWGHIRWRVVGCSVFEAQWRRESDGLEGTWRMQRLVGLAEHYAQCGEMDKAAVE